MLLREQSLGLTMQVATSDFKAPVASLVVRIYASRSYSDVVLGRRGARARRTPRTVRWRRRVPATWCFWEEQVVGSGPPAQLVAGIGPRDRRQAQATLRDHGEALTLRSARRAR